MMMGGYGSKSGAAYAQVVLADNPTHYWRLNDPSGPEAVDIGSSPSNGSYINCTLGQGGLVPGGGSVLFTPSQPSTVQCGGVGVLLLLNHSVELVFSTAVASGAQMLWKEGADMSVGLAIGFQDTNFDGTGVKHWLLLGQQSLGVNGITASITANTTHHLVYTSTSSGGTYSYVHAYLDGVRMSPDGGWWRYFVHRLDGHFMIGSARLWNDSSQCVSAISWTDNCEGFNGKIAEVATYNYVLSQAQVTSHFNASGIS